MKALKLLLLEDNVSEAQEISKLLKKHNYHITMVNTLSDAKKILEQSWFDIILLDILIQGNPDGIALAHYINSKNIDTPFLFLTSMQSKLIFESAKFTKPYSYLLKPFNHLELLYALDLALEKYYEQKNTLSFRSNNGVLIPNFLFIKKDGKLCKLNTSSIYYIQVQEKYCTIYGNTENFEVRLSLSKIKNILNKNFIQVHRKFLVNLSKIKDIYLEDNLLILKNKVKVSFSERYKANFIQTNTILK